MEAPRIVTVEEAENAIVKLDHLPALPMAARIAAPRRSLAGQNSRFDEFVQARRQNVAGNAEPLLKIGESLGAEKRLAQDQQRPPFPDFAQSLSGGAKLIFEWRMAHRSMVGLFSCVLQPNMFGFDMNEFAGKAILRQGFPNERARRHGRAEFRGVSGRSDRFNS